MTCAILAMPAVAVALDGNQLAEQLDYFLESDPDPDHRFFAASGVGFVMGTWETMKATRLVSEPKGVTPVQVVRVVRKNLHNNPERTHEPAIGLTMEALGAAFPPASK